MVTADRAIDAAEPQARTAADLGIPEQFNVATYLVDRNVQEGRGQQVAILSGDQQVTYAQVLERTNRLGNALKHLGVRPEERVALLVLDCPEFVYTFFGAIKIGAVPIPANTLLRPSDYSYLLNDARVRVAVVSEPLLQQLQAIPPDELRYLEEVVVISASGAELPRTLHPVGSGATVAVRAFGPLLESGSPDLEAAATSRDDAAFWLYSSGSTGFPKGCVHLHHDMVMCAELYAKGVLQITRTDRCFSVAKLFFAYGLGNGLYFPFAAGATTVLFPGPPTPPNVFEQVERHKPTLFFSVPTSYAMLLSYAEQAKLKPKTVFKSVRWGVSAGEALPPSIFERFRDRFGVQILDGIGSTEICHIFISNQPGAIRPGSSGKVVEGYAARIVEDDGITPVPRGEIGNLWVQGDSTCAYYWNRWDKTKDTIHGPWIKTGDKYYQDEDGFLWYAGRSDDMLKVGGIWVSPVEVENVLIEHPLVQECGVVGRADRDTLTKPAAYVVLKSGTVPSEALAKELQDFVRGKLAEYKRPRWVEFVDELPKTATGKTQRFRLRAGH